MRLLTTLIIALLKVLSYLPLGLLYLIADGLYLLLKHVVRYRKRVIYSNLRSSFPAKNKKELQQIADGFYRYFADMLVEIIKAHRMGVDDFKRRVRFTNIEAVNKVYDEGKSIILLTTHYGNWEWWVYAPHFLKHKLLIVYLPLRNKRFDRYMNSVRSKYGGVMLPIRETFRTVLAHHNRKEPTLTWICADQSAQTSNKLWVKFLNQETSFFTGGERIARKTRQAVFFLDVRREGRGRYALTFKEYTKTPHKLPANQISIDYAKDLERLIHHKPDYWLWSHKRWKHKRKEDLPVYE